MEKAEEPCLQLNMQEKDNWMLRFIKKNERKKMRNKKFIDMGNKLFIADCYGNDSFSNEEYDIIVESWERLRKFLEIVSEDKKQNEGGRENGN